MENLKIIKDEDVKATFSDILKGGYEAYPIQGIENGWVIVKLPDKEYTGSSN